MRYWWLQLARYIVPQAPGLSSVILLILIGVCVNLLKPWPLKYIVDYILPGKALPDYLAWTSKLPGGHSDKALLGWFAIGTVLIFLVGRVIRITEDFIKTGVGNRLVYGLGAGLFYHIQRLSLRFHSKRKTGDLLRRVTTDSSCVQDLTMSVFLPVLTSLTTLVMMFIVMWKLDRFLSFIAILVSVPLGILMWFFLRPMTEHSHEHQQLEGERMALSEQTLTALPIVQAFGREDYEDVRFRNLSRNTLKAYLRSIISETQFIISVSTVTAVGAAIIMTFGGLNVLQGTMTVGSLLVFLSYLASLYSPMETIANVSSVFATASAKARRVMEVLELEEDAKDTPFSRPFPVNPHGKQGYVCFDNVTFGYNPGHTVLKQVSFVTNPGETVALVGHTGAGKTTLVSLIPRFFDPWKGKVMINDVDIRDVKLSSLRSKVSILLQEPFLLPLTIAENISYGRPGATFKEIRDAAVSARADEFIRNLPHGYDTFIGERGAKLSGGEKQRIAIARALLRDAPILILDEPTSALDAQKEALLIEALENLMRDPTTFIISHRFSTIRFADKIIVLEQGEIVEIGNHKELLDRGGCYKSLYDLQLYSLSAGMKA